MENKLITRLNRVLPTGMYIPEKLALLYQWIEANNLYVDEEECHKPQPNIKKCCIVVFLIMLLGRVPILRLLINPYIWRFFNHFLKGHSICKLNHL